MLHLDELNCPAQLLNFRLQSENRKVEVQIPWVTVTKVFIHLNLFLSFYVTTIKQRSDVNHLRCHLYNVSLNYFPDKVISNIKHTETG